MYDTYVYDEHPQDFRHVRELLVQYQVQNNLEAAITSCSFSDEPQTRALTAMYMTDCEDSRARPLLAKLREQKTKHCIVLTAPDFAAIARAMTAQTLPAAMFLKPVAREALFTLLQELEQEQALTDEASYSWSVRARRYTIALEHILYFESRSKKTFLVTRAQEYELSATLDALEQELGERFVRTHRSFLVNQRHILSYDAGSMSVSLDDGSEVYLSRAGKARLKEALAW